MHTSSRSLYEGVGVEEKHLGWQVLEARKEVARAKEMGTLKQRKGNSRTQGSNYVASAVREMAGTEPLELTDLESRSDGLLGCDSEAAVAEAAVPVAEAAQARAPIAGAAAAEESDSSTHCNAAAGAAT